jgi:hypothetical protein
MIFSDITFKNGKGAVTNIANGTTPFNIQTGDTDFKKLSVGPTYFPSSLWQKSSLIIKDSG